MRRPQSGWCWPSTHCARPLGRRTRRPSGWGCCAGRSSATWAGWRPTTPTCGSERWRWRGRMPGGGGSTSTPWPGPAGLAAGRPRPDPHRPRRADGVAGGRRGTGRLSAGQRPGPPTIGRPGAAAASSAPIEEATAGSRRRWWPASATRFTRSGCWAPDRRRDWQAAQAALERLAGGRHRHQPHPDRADRDRQGRLDRTVGRQERDGR